ncbi:MFS transporter [Ursidibacter arcticus]
MNVQNIILWRKFFSGLAYTAMQSVFFIYLQYYKGFEPSQIACAFSLLVFSSQAFSMFAGYWGDRFERTNIMLLGCLLDTVAYILLLSTNSYSLLLVATFCFGFGSTLFSTNAKAFLLSNVENNYLSKTKAQGKFLKISSLASMIAPLLAIPFIFYKKPEWLIIISCLIEILMLLLMIKNIPKTSHTEIKIERFKLSQLKKVMNEQFIFIHILLFIPLGIGTAFYIIFPYLFTNLLDNQELVSISFFINNLIAVLFQSYFSRKLNLCVYKLLYIAPLLIIGLLVPWFYILESLTIITAFVYLIIFSYITLYTNTVLANSLVKLDTGENQGLMFGISKMLLALTTAGIMNILPHFFLI